MQPVVHLIVSCKCPVREMSNREAKSENSKFYGLTCIALAYFPPTDSASSCKSANKITAKLHQKKMPSVLWWSWLGGRKGIQPVKTERWEMLVWLSVWSEVQIWAWSRPSWCHCHSMFLASAKSTLALPFWYWLTQVIPNKIQTATKWLCCVCYYNYNRFTALWILSGTTRVSRYQKGTKTNLDFLSVCVTTEKPRFCQPMDSPCFWKAQECYFLHHSIYEW